MKENDKTKLPDFRTDSKIIEWLMNSSIQLAPDTLEALNDFKKIAHLKDMNQVIVNLLYNFSENTYKNLEKKYF